MSHDLLRTGGDMGHGFRFRYDEELHAAWWDGALTGAASVVALITVWFVLS
jgi:hypothetical protein